MSRGGAAAGGARRGQAGPGRQRCRRRGCGARAGRAARSASFRWRCAAQGGRSVSRRARPRSAGCRRGTYHARGLGDVRAARVEARLLARRVERVEHGGLVHLARPVAAAPLAGGRRAARRGAADGDGLGGGSRRGAAGPARGGLRRRGRGRPAGAGACHRASVPVPPTAMMAAGSSSRAMTDDDSVAVSAPTLRRGGSPACSSSSSSSSPSSMSVPSVCVRLARSRLSRRPPLPWPRGPPPHAAPLPCQPPRWLRTAPRDQSTASALLRRRPSIVQRITVRALCPVQTHLRRHRRDRRPAPLRIRARPRKKTTVAAIAPLAARCQEAGDATWRCAVVDARRRSTKKQQQQQLQQNRKVPA